MLQEPAHHCVSGSWQASVVFSLGYRTCVFLSRPRNQIPDELRSTGGTDSWEVGAKCLPCTQGIWGAGRSLCLARQIPSLVPVPTHCTQWAASGGVFKTAEFATFCDLTRRCQKHGETRSDSQSPPITQLTDRRGTERDKELVLSWLDHWPMRQSHQDPSRAAVRA